MLGETVNVPTSGVSGLVIVIVSAISGIVSISVAMITLFGNKRAKSAAESASTKIDDSVGIPNGHGSLMAQMLDSSTNQLQIQNHILHLNELVGKIGEQVSTHITLYKSDRESIGAKLTIVEKALTEHKKTGQEEFKTIRAQVATIENKLDDHVKWEMTQEFQIIGSEPWDGQTERRVVQQ